MCEEDKCKYHIKWLDTGNCALRVEREHTLEEIGIIFDLTRERVRQIVDKALKKCWHEIVKMEEIRPRYRKSKPGSFRVTRHN